MLKKDGHLNFLPLLQRFAIVLLLIIVGIALILQTKGRIPFMVITPIVPTVYEQDTNTPIVATLEPRPSATPSPTQVPCPESQVIGEVEIIFEGEIPDKTCNEVIKYVRFALDQFSKMGQDTGPMIIYVYDNAEELTDKEIEVARAAGCNPDSKANILALWNRGGTQVTMGAVFLLIPGWWEHEGAYQRASGVFGEMTQATITNILGSCQKRWAGAPDWYYHGLAEHINDMFTIAMGMEREPSDFLTCQEKLADLRPGERCIYQQAQFVFDMLRDDRNYGDGYGKSPEELLILERKNFDVLHAMANKSFQSAFLEIYGHTVAEFSKDYDEWLKIKYEMIINPPRPIPGQGD